MTLKELLEKTSRFQKVTISYCGESKTTGKTAYLLDDMGEGWLSSPVLEIRADFSELLVEVGD